ncbi:MAG: hypothetical protein WHS65_05105 [Melioribacteraceae bacterium]
MNKIIFNIIILYSVTMIIKAQQDTLIYDSSTGNYIIQYMRENLETGERDSLVTEIFVPATKIEPSVRAWVDFKKDSSMYIYNYEIENGIKSKQNLIVFRIQFGKKVDVMEKSTQKWLGRKRQGFDDKHEYMNRIWSWYGNQGLEPGWKKGGFALGSNGIPGIGAAYFQGLAPILSYRHGPPPEHLEKEIAKLEVFPSNHVKRTTVVPVSLPVPFNTEALIDTLISYTQQSGDIGWLGKDPRREGRDEDCDEDEKPEDGIVKNIIKRLERAKILIEKEDSLKAKKELEKLLSKIEKIWKRSQEEEKRGKKGVRMSSEAYALLKYNTEYLVEKLPDKVKKIRKEEKNK